MLDRTRRGFTLIELLTVIAIITILASITFAVFPRIRERAKLRQLNAVFIELRTALAQYYADHGTYPPAYGYMKADTRDVALEDIDLTGDNDTQYMWTKPYLDLRGINFHNNPDYADTFSSSYDTNNDGRISLLEFSPIGVKDIATGRVDFSTDLFDGTNNGGEVNLQLDAEQRPLLYIPVNTRQFKKARQFWIQNPEEDYFAAYANSDTPRTGFVHFFPNSWDFSDPLLEDMTFPPPNYDAYVLISVGPAEDTFGIIPTDENGFLTQITPEVYHIMGLRAYFLATRDMNDDGALDFDYEARAQGNQAELEYDVTVNGANYRTDNWLPVTDRPRGYGPKIFTSN